MSDVYRPHILDHYANPRNQGRLDAPDIVADADDPSCGDQLRLEIALDAHGRVAQVAFEGEGCIVSMASASIFTESVKGKSLEELEALSEEDALALLDAPVSAARRRCALLPLKVLQTGLKTYREPSP
ncbi:MAG: iron-sulfur cluster assembly scaffold protein [Anaerolineae bacterium]|nr:iron-sulfur cluster assembly scaffold protein [Anaerolineae bacterium]